MGNMFQMPNGGSLTELGNFQATSGTIPPYPITLTGTRVTVLAVNSSDQTLLENDSAFQEYYAPGFYGSDILSWHPSTTTYTATGNTVPFCPYLPTFFGSTPTPQLLSNVALGKSYVLGSDAQISWNADGMGAAIFSAPGHYYCWDGTTTYTLPEPGSPPTIVPQAVNAATTLFTPPGSTDSVTVAATQIIGNYRNSGNNSVTGYLWEMAPTTSTTKSFGPPQNLNDLLAPKSGFANFYAIGINDGGCIIGSANALDSNGNPILDANGNPVYHGVLLCPMDAVQDSQNDHVIDMTDQRLTYVRFGLWDNAFDSSVPANVLNGNAESANFVGSDSRRFYIRVYDPSATTTTVTADWYTKKSDGTDDDHPATDTITLTRSSSNPAVYVSKALMLVADEVDNAQPTNTGLSGGGNAAEGAADHRLRRAALDDKMCYAYTPAAANSTKATFTEPIFGPAGSPDAIKSVSVQFVKAIGGKHNANTVNQAIVNNMETQISSRYALAGIKVNFTYNDATDAITVPTSIDLGAITRGSASPSTGDEAVMIQLLRTKYGAYTAANKTIYVIVIGEFNTPSLSGESYSPNLAGTYPNAVDCCFVSQLNTRPGNLVVEPHEIGHVLLERVAADGGPDGQGHYEGLSFGQNLMCAGATDLGSVIGSKRLWDDPTHNDGVHDYQIDYMRLSPLLY